MAWYDKVQYSQLGENMGMEYATQAAKALEEDIDGSRVECPVCEVKFCKINRLVYRAAGFNFCPICGGSFES